MSTLGLPNHIVFRAYRHRRFYGILLCQGRWYFRTYREDATDMKLTVSDVPPHMLVAYAHPEHPQVAAILYESLQL